MATKKTFKICRLAKQKASSQTTNYLIHIWQQKYHKNKDKKAIYVYNYEVSEVSLPLESDVIPVSSNNNILIALKLSKKNMTQSSKIHIDGFKTKIRLPNGVAISLNKIIQIIFKRQT